MTHNRPPRPPRPSTDGATPEATPARQAPRPHAGTQAGSGTDPPGAAAAAHRPLVTLLVPAKDEGASIAAMLRSLPVATLAAMGFRTETVVLDGNSKDDTAAIARAAGAIVVADREPGKGAAVRHARAHIHGDYVVMLDADGTYATDSIPRAVSRLAWGGCDVVMGQRRPLPGAMPRVNRVGNVLLSTMATTLYGRRSRDVCTGLWGFRADALRRMPLRSRGFGLEAELFALTARLGLRLGHLRVDYLPRHGTPKLSASRDGYRIARRLVRTRFGAVRPERVRAVPAAAAPLAAPAITVAEDART